MDTDLMHTASFYSTLEKRIFITNIRFNSRIVCDRFLTIWIDSYFGFILGILDSQKSGSDRISRLQWSAYYYSMVYFLYAFMLQEIEELLERLLVLRDHDTATRISVDAMDECGLIG